ncbi:MAG: hypothetical protein NZ959_08050 [Armatimonadetes bacterium]|nr:hypothetical protein [Armatimonadota bacterium]MDW8122965.1 galactokinase family protein [Armatimonadota bacterium]
MGATTRISRWHNWVHSDDWFRWAKAVYGPWASQRMALFRQLIERAAQQFGTDATGILARAPGRVNLMGRHIDHRGGRCHPIAIPKEILVFAHPSDRAGIRLHHWNPAHYPDEAFRLSDVAPQRFLSEDEWQTWVASISSKVPQNWSLYARAAVATAINWSEIFDLTNQPFGVDLLITGDIPPEAGLSSSSALFVACLLSVAALWGKVPDDKVRMAQLCGMGEWYVGTRGGFGDHAAILLGKKDQVTVLDFFPMAYDYRPFLEGADLIVLDSGERAHKASDARKTFNIRILEYELGVLLWHHQCPQLSQRLAHLRDAAPYRVGDEALSYRLLKVLPPSTTIRQLIQNFEELKPMIQGLIDRMNIGAVADELVQVRGTCWFGLAECERSLRFTKSLGEGNWALAGQLMTISHDGDRLFLWKDGEPLPYRFPVDDQSLDRCFQSRQPFWSYPGAYRCSSVAIDFLVDQAIMLGAIGAQVCGAGMGGSVLVLAPSGSGEQIAGRLAEEYASKLGKSLTWFSATPIEGAQVLMEPP